MIHYPQMVKRIHELEHAIKKFLEASENDLCHENRKELWAVLHNDQPCPQPCVPDWDEFLENCVKYRKSLEV